MLSQAYTAILMVKFLQIKIFVGSTPTTPVIKNPKGSYSKIIIDQTENLIIITILPWDLFINQKEDF